MKLLEMASQVFPKWCRVQHFFNTARVTELFCKTRKKMPFIQDEVFKTTLSRDKILNLVGSFFFRKSEKAVSRCGSKVL